MTFFNQDEETISIELTKHGRELLSRGVMKPFFYSFSDDDILYDIARGGGSENNSQIQSRIVSQTPYMKPQTNYKGIDSSKNDNDSKVNLF